MALTIDRPVDIPARPRAAQSRTRPNRFTAAALLPAGLVSAILVAAPFAGTTTHTLSAQSRPAAVATSVTAHAPASTVPAAVSASDTAASSGTTGAPGVTDAQNVDHGFSLTVPKASVRNLVIPYLLITMLGAAVIITAAVRSGGERQRR